VAFPYRDTGEYLAHVLAFIGDGLACSEPVFVALPAISDHRYGRRRVRPAGGWPWPI